MKLKKVGVEVKLTEKEIEEPEPEEKKEAKELSLVSPVQKAKSKKKEVVFDSQEEGQLVIDIYQTDDELVIQSAIAGVKPGDFDVSIEKDMITIKGKREKPFPEEGDYFLKECYWGTFSREIILPVEVDSGRANAEMKDGVLTIRMPKEGIKCTIVNYYSIPIFYMNGAVNSSQKNIRNRIFLTSRMYPARF